MATLSSVRATIADYINRNDFDSQIDKAINSAIAYFQGNNFFFQQTSGTFDTVAAQESYIEGHGVPSDIGDIDVAQYTLSSGDFELNRVSYKDFLRLNPNDSQGQPISYSWWQEEFYVFPVPDKAYPIILWYWKNYPELVDNDDTNDFLDNASDLIIARCMWSLSTYLLRQFDVASVYKQAEMDELYALRQKTTNLTVDGKIASNCY